VICLIAAGERQAEIIRKVAFELADFQAYRIFKALARHSHTKRGGGIYTSQDLLEMPSIQQQQRDIEQSPHIDEMGMYGFFRTYYEGASGEEEVSSILSRPINEDESKFLVRLMDKHSQGAVAYEEFLDFILPRTKKRFSQAFVKKVTKKRCAAADISAGMSRFDVSYDAICSLCRLFEKEVELFRMVSKLIKKVSQTLKGGADTINNSASGANTLQISDVFQAMDV
jgi:hypothetical protein